MGTLSGVSDRAETIQIQIGPAIWIVKYDDNTKVKGISELEKIPKEKEVAITFAERNGILYAMHVAVKQPAAIPDEKKIKVYELSKLIETKSDFVLVDSRPAPRFHEGHIPGAIPIYDAEFDKNIEKLPKEKTGFSSFTAAESPECSLHPLPVRQKS